MKFMRVLSAGLMALLCAGTALAASQLNAVHVTPKGDTATVSLQTTGSFAHKEYRPEEHMLLIDMTGVTSDPNLVRTVLFRSPVLKSYALSSYTSAAGTEVTRLALMLGDNVSAEVVDASGGLSIMLSGGDVVSASAMAKNGSASSPAAMAKSTPPRRRPPRHPHRKRQGARRLQPQLRRRLRPPNRHRRPRAALLPP